MKKLQIALLLLTALHLFGQAAQPTIDQNHSSVAFYVPILNGMSKVHGKFTNFDVQLNYDDADVTKSSVKATIQVASIDTGIADRDKDLNGPAFFDSAKFPTIIFESTSVAKQGDHFVATGLFTMHGVTREITLPFKLTGKITDPKTGKKNVGFAATLQLNRREYGINWTHSVDPNFVGDVIEVELEILTKRF